HRVRAGRPDGSRLPDHAESRFRAAGQPRREDRRMTTSNQLVVRSVSMPRADPASRKTSLMSLIVTFCASASAGGAVAQDAAIPAFKTLDSMEARTQGCTTCHGQSGQGTNNEYFPRIAGKPAGYLYNQ